jgi:hypothetical protein
MALNTLILADGQRLKNRTTENIDLADGQRLKK